MAPVPSIAADGRAGDAAGLAPVVEGRSRGHEFLGRSALSVPRRRRVRLSGAIASALEVARPLPRQVLAALAGRTLSAEGNRLAAQGDVPSAAGQLPRPRPAPGRWGMGRAIAE